MILKLDETLFSKSEEEKAAYAHDICVALEHGHFLNLLPRFRKQLDELIEATEGKRNVNLYNNLGNRKFCNNSKIEYHLRHIDDFMSLGKIQREVIVSKEAEVLLENSVYEWEAYRRFVHTYEKDKTYGDIVRLIKGAISNDDLIFQHAGGVGNMVELVRQKERTKYHDMYRYKVCVVFDRDTNDSSYFTPNNNVLFCFLTDDENKTANNIQDEDIYKLDFQDKYIWHSWYKRSIENYVPKDNFIDMGVDLSDVTEEGYDYLKFAEDNKIPKGMKKRGYKKSMMKDAMKGVTRDYLESSTKHFQIGNADYSEILLVLMKIAKII